MSWLRSSPLRASFNKQRSRDSPPKDADPSACYDSFCKHWQQTYEIIQRTTPPNGKPNQDDVLGVVNHIDQMVTLLVLELRDTTFSHTYRPTTTPTHSPCLEYLLSENLLVKLYEWSLHTGRFNNAVRLEELKLHELLVSHSGTLLAHEPVARPLLWLLDECANDIMPLEVEKKLVVLLNHLCVSLMQNMALLDLFFHSTPTGKSKFIIFTLLIPHVHREGAVGQQARDAMLLCMSLSKKHDAVGLYIADHSNICPVLATGLSGLYSLLPRKLDIETDDWHRLTPDDVNDLPAVTQLMNSLEFCNAVAQVAHPTVQKQLLEFLYQGFLVPVMGPALLQTTVEELVAATAYFDLFLRSVTEPGLLRSLVRFLLEDNYDECRILDSLIQRISSRSRLCIVTLALFETLVNLNCEDVMLELCLAALNPCSHVMFSQRRRLKDIDPFGRAAEKFLSLTPSCCSLFPIKDSVSNSLPNTVFSTHDKSVNIASDTLKSLSLVNYSTKLTESLYGNYHAYLCDARQKITACRIACSNWSCQYNGEVSKSSSTSGIPILIEENKSSHISSKKIIHNTDILTDTSKHANVAYSNAASPSSSTILEDSTFILVDNKENCEDMFTNTECSVPLALTLCTEEQAKLDADIADLLNESNAVTEFATEPSLSVSKKDDNNMNDSNTAFNSLLSFGESSGYESFAFKGSYESTPDNEPDEEPVIYHKESESESSPELNAAQNIMNMNSTLIGELISNKKTKEVQRQDIFNGEPNVGIFLDVILRKLECMTSNNLYVNLHLTGLISRLAIYPQPLLQSFLLNHSLVFQPSVRSLFQVLASLKHKIDQFLSSQADVDVLVEEARSFLIGREDRLVHARKNLLEAAAHTSKRNSSTSDPFSRGESKRKSLTSSFTQMFKRSSSGSGPSALSTSVTEQSSLSENQIEITGFRTSYRRYHPRISWESPDKISPVQNVILCAVLLDEWLKELAAITQEHAIISLTKSFEYKL